MNSLLFKEEALLTYQDHTRNVLCVTVQLKFQCRAGDENISVSFLSAPDLSLTIVPSNHDVGFNTISFSLVV